MQADTPPNLYLLFMCFVTRICRAPPPRGPSNWTSSSSVRFISLKSTKNLSKYVVLEREAEQEVRVVSEDEN